MPDDANIASALRRQFDGVAERDTTAAPSRRRSVLIIVENLPVPPDRRVWQEAVSLHEAGYQVTVISPRRADASAFHEVVDGVHIYRHPLPEAGGGALGYVIEYVCALAAQTGLAWWVFLRRGFDVIQACNPPDTIFLVALPFKVLLRRKFVFDQHDPGPELFTVKFPHRRGIHRLLLLLERMTFRLADRVITTSEPLRAIAAERGGKPSGAVHLVRSAPDLKKLRRVAPNPELKRGHRYMVVYVGIMNSQDGVDVLVDAAEHVIARAKRMDIHFLVVGSGPEQARLQTRVHDLGLTDHVRFTGYLSGQPLLEALSSADIGVVPDPCNVYNDKISLNKVIEYMAVGLPMVMFPLTEAREMAGSAARVAAGPGAEHLADAILDLLDDGAARRRMAEYARARAAELFDWQDHRHVYLQAYHDLLRKAPGERRLNIASHGGQSGITG